MLEFTAYIAAQELTQKSADEARPGAPARPDHARPRLASGWRGTRRAVSLALRRIADGIEPAPQPDPLPTASGC
jgi:hypothetical protein